MPIAKIATPSRLAAASLLLCASQLAGQSRDTLATRDLLNRRADSLDRAPVVTHRFYMRRSYGSDAEFNPLSLVLDGGYDQLRTGTFRPIARLPYDIAFRTVMNSLAHPDRVLSQYGYHNWVRNELFPLTTKAGGGGQWVPRYELHLFAGGMTYRRLVEWYEQHGLTSHPELAAGTTAYMWFLLTEMIENGGHKGYNVDALTDLGLADAGCIVLWNQEWMQRMFSGRVEFTNWMGQFSLSPPHGTIENANMMAMLRMPLPRTDDWRLMTTLGNAFLIGPSRRVGREYWVSLAGGFDPVDNPVINETTNQKTVDLAYNAGAFLDRNGSLLVGFINKGGSTNGPTLNVYPGVVRLFGVSPGFWVQQVRGGGVRFGLVSALGLGIGWIAH